MTIKTNEGPVDRGGRLLLGVLFGSLGLIGPAGFFPTLFAVLSTMMLATACLGFCPVYGILGFDTSPDEKRLG